MEIAATLNPVTYVMEALRSLILEDLDWGDHPDPASPLWPCWAR